MVLAGRKILLGVTGGIAAYKAVEIASRLRKKGAEVHVVMTKEAAHFVTPLTFREITGQPVSLDMWEEPAHWNVEHIALARLADLVLIAPATANIIAKAAAGIADDMLTTTLLAVTSPIFFAPAMNSAMYENPVTQENMAKLQARGWHKIEPATGYLACGASGVGRLPEPQDIVRELEEAGACGKTLAGKKVLVTAGGTLEAIDPVRFIGNHSTGRMGIALAEEFARRGAEVDLILGPSSLKPSEAVRTTRVTTAEEMLQATEEVIEEADIAIFSAAVADYRPRYHYTEKIKREGQAEMELELVRNPDIAATLGARKRPEQFFVGFALESNAGVEEAKRKMHAKHFDAIVLNSLQDAGAGFAHETNKVTIFDREGSIEAYELKSKDAVAHDIASFIIKRLGE